MPAEWDCAPDWNINQIVLGSGYLATISKDNSPLRLVIFDRKFLNAPLHCDTRSFARKSYLHTDPAEFLSLCHFITSHDITGHLKIILYLIIGDALS